MKEKSGKVSPKAIVGLVLVIGVICYLFHAGCAAVNTLSRRAVCQNHLHCFDIALQCHCYPPVSNYPPSLVMLDSNDIAKSMFVCPGVTRTNDTYTNHAYHEMDAYSDYIYVQGLSPRSPTGIPMILCPPENHGGKGGNILFSDHPVGWIPARKFDVIISNLYANTNYGILVGGALSNRTNGRYKSRPL